MKVSRKTVKCSITPYLEFEFHKSTIIDTFAPVRMYESKAQFGLTQGSVVVDLDHVRCLKMLAFLEFRDLVPEF